MLFIKLTYDQMLAAEIHIAMKSEVAENSMYTGRYCYKLDVSPMKVMYVYQKHCLFNVHINYSI